MCQIGVEAVQSSPSAQCHSSTASQPASQPCTEHTSLSPFLSAFLSLSISLALRARGTYCPHVSFLCQPPVPLPTVHVCLVSLSCPSFCLPRCMSCLSTYSSSSPPPICLLCSICLTVCQPEFFTNTSVAESIQAALPVCLICMFVRHLFETLLLLLYVSELTICVLLCYLSSCKIVRIIFRSSIYPHGPEWRKNLGK